MPPRASTKVKRGPELWNPKKKKSVSDGVPEDDEWVMRITPGPRAKFAPGPDAANAVVEEFYNIPLAKSPSNSRAPSTPVAGLSQTPLTCDPCKKTFSVIYFVTILYKYVTSHVIPFFPVICCEDLISLRSLC